MIRIWDTSVPPLDDPFMFSSVVDQFGVVFSLYTQYVGYRDVVVI